MRAGARIEPNYWTGIQSRARSANPDLREMRVSVSKRQAGGVGNRSALRSPRGARRKPEALSDARVPGLRCRDAKRLECLLFLGYDPHFDGDEPPGL